MPDLTFAQQLRRFRKEARLSQRALAAEVDVSFTYLSKIENGHFEPPSEKVIRHIARVLAQAQGQDETRLADHLIALAGKVPQDISETLVRHPEAVRFLRSLGSDVRTQKEWQELIEKPFPPKGDDEIPS